MNFRHVAITALVLALLLSSACSRPVIKAYPGPELPPGQTAVVESGAFTEIVRLDGQSVSSQALSILPGPHTVDIRIVEEQQPMFDGYVYYSAVHGSIDFLAEPGYRYIASVDFIASPFPVSNEKDSGFRWVGYVTDRTTKRTVGHTDYLPLEAWPRIPLVLGAAP